MVEKLVLKWFMICMLPECQVLVKKSGVKTCKVGMQGQEFLVQNPDDQKSPLPKTIPETGEMEGVAPKENLEKGLMGDMEETRTHQSEEPGLLKEARQDETTSLDKEFSGKLGSLSIGSPGTVGSTSLPKGKETWGRASYEYRVCKKKSPYQSQLTLHQRTHTGARPFKCSFCVKVCMQPSNLWVHQRIHTGKKPHCCDLCPKKFTSIPILPAHERTHTQEKLSSVSSVTRPSATGGNSVFTDAPTLGSNPTCVPNVTVPSISWGLSYITRKAIPNGSPRILPSGPSPFCSKEEIQDDLSPLWYKV
ncbi:hypothetical protein FD754_004521 [Muntiacus muntjak]|uniref:C2H2-type domain-containing protein n=1 Tax=Muntiacus muntjak TaxID=9888 RepID=A0A5N3WI28_MUNMU|nr:hypothetical protein FD754_004521 [Muntiacus muntjak]